MGTSKSMILVPLFDLKSWIRLRQVVQELQIGGTRVRRWHSAAAPGAAGGIRTCRGGGLRWVSAFRVCRAPAPERRFGRESAGRPVQEVPPGVMP